MHFIEPNPQHLAEFVERLQCDPQWAARPLAMLNLLRYRDQACYPDDAPEAACSGREAYGRYAKQALTHVQAVGGEVIFHAQAWLSLIGPEDESWDDVFIVKYPNAQAFLSMVQQAEYQAILHHRQAALADSRLLAMDGTI